MRWYLFLAIALTVILGQFGCESLEKPTPIPGARTFTSTTAATKSDLADALDELRDAMLKKLDSDIENTSLAFTGVKDYWRVKRWADIFTAPLRVLEDTLSLVAKASTVDDLITETDRAMQTSVAAYQIVGVVLMYQDLQKVGEKLQHGLDGLTYVAAVESMLDAADAVNPPFGFNSEAYRDVVKNHLWGGSQDVSGPLIIPRKSTTVQRQNAELVRGALGVRTRISRLFSELTTQVRNRELPEGFPVDEVVDHLRQLKTRVLESMLRGTDVRYKVWLRDNDHYVSSEAETKLGAVAEHHRAFGQIAGKVADKLRIEQYAEVVKLVDAAENAYVLLSIEYRVPGTDAVKVVQKANFPAGMSLRGRGKLFYKDAEEVFYSLPQEMVLSLPIEFSNLLMIADDADQYVRYLLSKTTISTPTPAATRTSAVIPGQNATPTRTYTPTPTPSPTATVAPTPIQKTEILSLETKWTKEIKGECWTSSLAVVSPNAWRCMSESNIFDPAFSNVPSDNFVTYYTPITHLGIAEGIKINLTKPLPIALGHKENHFYAVLIELFDGMQCRFFQPPTGTLPPGVPNLLKLKVSYDCSDGSYILGDPEVGSVWSVNKAQLSKSRDQIETSTRAPVRRAWRY